MLYRSPSYLWAQYEVYPLDGQGRRVIVLILMKVVSTRIVIQISISENHVDHEGSVVEIWLLNLGASIGTLIIT